MKPLFFTDDAEFKVESTEYSLEPLVRLCDNSDMHLNSKGEPSEAQVHKVQFIVRTLESNLILVNKDNQAVFNVECTDITPRGITLNDFIILSAKDLLYSFLYEGEYSPIEISTSAYPVPFGAKITEDNEVVVLFQLAINHSVLNKFKEGWKLISVSEHDDENLDFEDIRSKFIFTEN